MNLSGLLSLCRLIPAYESMARALRGGEPAARSVLGVAESARPFLIAAVLQDLGRPILVLVRDAQRARRVYQDLVAWSGRSDALFLYPGYQGLFYDRVTADAYTVQQRAMALAALAGEHEAGPGMAVIVDVRTAMQRVREPARQAGRRLSLRRDSSVNLGSLLTALVSLGYEPVTNVVEPGSFARRGGIVDVFSPAHERPFRLELMGDEVDSIRLFDPITQRSEARIEQAVITAAKDLTADLVPDLLAMLSRLDLATLRPEMAERWRGDTEALARGDLSSIYEPYASYVARASLLDHLDDEVVIVLDEPAQLARASASAAEEAETLRADLVARGELPDGLPRPYFPWEDLAPRLADRRRLLLSSETDEDAAEVPRLPFGPHPVYGGRLKAALDEWLAAAGQGERVVVTSNQADRLCDLLAERDVFVTVAEELRTAPASGSLVVLRGTLVEGWKSQELGTRVVSDAELFGWAKPRPLARRHRRVPANLLSDLSAGDYVVHVDHGVGRFQSLTRMTVDGVERDYLVLEYASGDRMFVPVDQADRVSRYHGAGDEPPTLNRLGTAEWARAKQRVKSSTRDIAKDLLALYSARQVASGYACAVDTPWQAELEASFPYVETLDQLQAVNEVKEDMESPRPMDRLICGDVGYGKTEVALRAAFKAVMDGRQVAVLVPTTVLAQQHFDTFRERLRTFPVNVEMLSRFRSPRQQKKIVADLAAGRVDVCIGTHRLLQKDITFKNLGLVVVDEEHRFGVSDKERLKRLRREVDVLTLSATPIPRTLYMSLSGVRDMSTIATPPEERLPIKTYLGEFRDSIVREGILREMERGGQVFFVHNRVQGIEQVAQRLARLVPEAKVGVGHGQMGEADLERVMQGFSSGEFDVLVSTSIIESGLDIPNANTIVINNADRFGLAQLYQLRGRVGRSANRAYAYLLFAKDRRLTQSAEKRLRTIFEANDLGAGFQIALRDLEIRGAGNILGAEQHGHIAAVGFDLYCRLLAQAVQELQGKQPEEVRPAPVILDLPLAAYFSPDYVADEATRLNLYQRLAVVSTEDEALRLSLEVRDRFGPPPEEALNLLYLVQLKTAAARAGIQAIFAEERYLVLRFAAEATIDRAAIVRRFGRQVHLGSAQIKIVRSSPGSPWQDMLREVIEVCSAGVAATK